MVCTHLTRGHWRPPQESGHMQKQAEQLQHCWATTPGLCLVPTLARCQVPYKGGQKKIVCLQQQKSLSHFCRNRSQKLQLISWFPEKLRTSKVQGFGGVERTGKPRTAASNQNDALLPQAAPSCWGCGECQRVKWQLKGEGEVEKPRKAGPISFPAITCRVPHGREIGLVVESSYAWILSAVTLFGHWGQMDKASY